MDQLLGFQWKKKDFNNVPLLLTLLACDHDQEPVYRTHGVPMHQWFLCTEGSGVLTINNYSYRIGKGNCFFIRADDAHEYHATSDHWVLQNIGFNGNICPSLLKTLHMQSSGAYHISDATVFQTHLEQIRDIAADQEMDSAQACIRYSQIVYNFLTELSVQISRFRELTSSKGNPIVREIVEFLETHYTENISLDDIASQINRTPEYICNVFKEVTGETIVHHLTSLRIIQAQILLAQEPSLTAGEIGLMCGFQSAGYFGRVFRKWCGMTPNQYRMKQL